MEHNRKFQALVSGNVRINGRVYHPTIAEHRGCPLWVIAEAMFYHMSAVLQMDKPLPTATRTAKRKRIQWSQGFIKRV